MKLVNSQAIENYGAIKELQRRFVFNHIFDAKFQHATLFDTIVKPLANSAFQKGLQHSLVLYEPFINNYYLDFLGIFDQQKDLDECQLFHTLKYIIELCNLKSDLQTSVQVSMVAIKENRIIDLYNQDEPMESPLGYSLERTEHIESFLNYGHNLVAECPDIEHLCVSIYYQNKIALPNGEFEPRDACLNFIIIRGDKSIHLPSFLNNDKDAMNANTMSNHVEKLLLHFLSSSYDPENLPYSDSTLSYFLKKYLPYSTRKEMVLFTDMQEKSIEEIANHLLYAELCQEVAEAAKEESQDYTTESRPEEGSAYESRILQNLSITRDRIQSEFYGLQNKKSVLEDSVVKLESASTAGTNPNPLSQIQKFSLNSQYERFLHEMNHKLADLVHASDRLLTEVSTAPHKDSLIYKAQFENLTPRDRDQDQERGPTERNVLNARKRRYITPIRAADTNITDDKDQISSMRQGCGSVIVKDEEHKYPSVMLNDSGVLDKDHQIPTYRTNISSKPIESENRLKSSRNIPPNSLIGNIELLQKELQHNLEFFSANFETLKRQIENQEQDDHLSQRSKQSRNILQSIIEQKRAEYESFKENNEKSINASLEAGHLRYLPPEPLKEYNKQQIPANPQTSPYQMSQEQFKSNSKNSISKNKPKELIIPPLHNKITEVDESPTATGKFGQLTTKRTEEPVLLTMRSGGLQTSRGIESKIPMSVHKKERAKEKETEAAELKKQEMLGQTWRKLFAFSYKDINSMMNNLFFSLSKENQGNAICGGAKSTQKINPTDKFQIVQSKVEMVSTIEEFRTTYEKFETLADQNSDNERFQRLQNEDSKCIEEDEEEEFDQKRDGVAELPLTKEFLNNSIPSIKPIENKASTISIPFSPDMTPNRQNKESIKVTDLYDFDSNKVDPRNPYTNNGLNNVLNEREKFNQSIMNKLEQLDKEDLKTKVIRTQTYM